jgi:subtilisin
MGVQRIFLSVSSIRIVSSHSSRPPVVCRVSEYSADALLRTALCKGVYDVADPDRAMLLMISPLDGHWSKTVDYDPNLQEVCCDPIVGDIDAPWWQALVHGSSVAPRSAAKLRIGVIDLLYEAPAELQHVAFVDPDDWKQSIRNLGNRQLHGQRVSAIVSARGPDGFRGLAWDAELFFVDASFVGQQGASGVDSARVVDGVRTLSSIHNVDIINISCGFGQAELPDLEDRIEEAADAGTLCICAGGNTGGALVEMPASLPTTIGVGGIGFTGVAPLDSVMGELAGDATNDGLLGTGQTGWPGRPFHDRRTSEGAGIDVSAPSMGVVVRSGGQISDLSGTSFACPIVVGVLACELAKDVSYLHSSGRKRYDLARQRLASITRPIGLDPKKVGNGVPVVA